MNCFTQTCTPEQQGQFIENATGDMSDTFSEDQKEILSFFDFLIRNGFDPDEFSKNVSRSLATRLSVALLKANSKITSEDVAEQRRSAYPDVSIQTQAGKEIALATFLGIVRGYNNGYFYPAQTPTLAETYQIVVELGRIISPKIAAVLREETIKSAGSPDWFEKYARTLTRFQIPTVRNYWELSEQITPFFFVSLTYAFLDNAGIADPFSLGSQPVAAGF